MKLPFVSRLAYELVVADKAKSEEREAKWVERYDALRGDRHAA